MKNHTSKLTLNKWVRKDLVWKERKIAQNISRPCNIVTERELRARRGEKTARELLNRIK